MLATKNGGTKPDTVLVDRKKLQEALGCGRSVAEQIAQASKASVFVGRRHLYNLSKIQKYIDSISQ